MRRSKSKVTITDIALRAGVSATAVSAALHGTGRVSDGQRELIQKLAIEMNYQPSVAAQIMRSNGANGIALVISDDYEAATESGFTAPLIACFVRKCEMERLRYHIDFAREEMEISPAPPSMRGGLVSGAIVAGKMPDPLREWINGQDRYPWVCIDDPAPYTVVSSVDDAMEEAVSRLAALRHQRIAFGGCNRDILTHAMIQDGFKKAMREYDLRVDESCFALFDIKSRVEMLAEYTTFVDELLSGSSRPTAVVCADSKLARVVVYVAMKLGLKVPEDLSVIGYGTSGDAEKGIPCLTMVQPDFAGMIDKSVTILQHLTDGKRIETGTHRVPAKFIQRNTVTWAKV